MLQAQQYKSKTFPSIRHTIFIAVQKSFWAHKVFVWKKEDGEILKLTFVFSSSAINSLKSKI
jgi:hypothetical protein